MHFTVFFVLIKLCHDRQCFFPVGHTDKELILTQKLNIFRHLHGFSVTQKSAVRYTHDGLTCLQSLSVKAECLADTLVEANTRLILPGDHRDILACLELSKVVVP